MRCFEGGPYVSFENMATDGSAIIFAEHHVRMSGGCAIRGANVAYRITPQPEYPRKFSCSLCDPYRSTALRKAPIAVKTGIQISSLAGRVISLMNSSPLSKISA